jgi:hypothetical protein
MASPRERFRSEIPLVLAERGPSKTHQLYSSIRERVPEYCDESILCACGGIARDEPEWKHQLRWAQQDLRKAGIIVLSDAGWDMARGGRF